MENQNVYYQLTITEEKICSSSIYGSLLFNLCPDVILVTHRLSGRILKANRAAEFVYGYSSDELLCRSVNDLQEGLVKIDPSSTPQLTDLSSRFTASQHRTKDGTVFPVTVLSIQMEINKIPVTLNYIRDVSCRKQSTQALFEVKSLLYEFLDPSNDCVLVYAGRQIVYANLAAVHILGAHSVEEIEGKDIFSLIPPEDRARIAERKARIDQGAPVESPDVKVLRLDGRVVDFEVDRFPIIYRGEPAVFMIGKDITWRKHLEDKLFSQVSQLMALRLIDQSILSTKDLNQTLEVILRQLTVALQVDAADFLLYHPDHKKLVTTAVCGMHSTEPVWLPGIPLEETHAGRAALFGEMVFIPDLSQYHDQLTERLQQIGEHFSSYLAVRLQAMGELKGVLQIYHRNSLTPDEDWLGFLKSLADQAAIAISDSQLFDALKRSNQELMGAYDLTIDGWSRALDLRDAETEGHSQRVTDLTMALARQMGIGEEQLVHIRRGARLHDIGKMGIPDHILLKPGELTPEEWEIMRKHPTLAVDLLYPIHFLSQALEIPYGHHEKWDGSGYPQGLKGVEIPLSARIFAVIDVFDALTNARPYRPAWTKEKALDYIREQSGKHFDPRVVAQFLSLMVENTSRSRS